MRRGLGLAPRRCPRVRRLNGPPQFLRTHSLALADPRPLGHLERLAAIGSGRTENSCPLLPELDPLEEGLPRALVCSESAPVH